jgi:hypothetical protein
MWASEADWRRFVAGLGGASRSIDPVVGSTPVLRALDVATVVVGDSWRLAAADSHG